MRGLSLEEEWVNNRGPAQRPEAEPVKVEVARDTRTTSSEGVLKERGVELEALKAYNNSRDIKRRELLEGQILTLQRQIEDDKNILENL